MHDEIINFITKLTSYVNCIVNIMINSLYDQVARLPVPEDKVSWSVEWADYAPQDFTAPFVQGVSVRLHLKDAMMSKNLSERVG